MRGARRETLLVAGGFTLLGIAVAGTVHAVAPYFGLPSPDVLREGTLDRVPIAGSLSAALALGVTAAAALAVAVGAVVTARRARHRRDRLEERLLRLARVAAQAGELVAIVNRTGRIEFVNPAVERLTGYTRKELVGRRHHPWLPWYESEQVFDILRSTVSEGGAFTATVACRRKDGTPFWLQEEATALRDRRGRLERVVSTATDVSRIRRLEDRLKYLGAHDAVTGLPNRSRFLGELTRRLAKGRPAAVMVMTIDRFRMINEMFGPTVGDEVLRHVASEVVAAVSADDVVARLGSDEFGVIYGCEGRVQDAEAVAERIRKAVSGTLSVAGEDVVATLTIGIANPEDGRDGPSLLRHACMALSRAKSVGRNGILVYSQDFSGVIHGTYSMERRLAGALKNGEFDVDYQPYCDLASRRITGAEALLRWRNPDLGPVSPALFIPALEESGAILEVGEWVLRAACRQAGDWSARHPGVGVAVNLSQIQFRDRNLVGMVADALRESRVDPGLLTLELTEGICITDMELTVGVLKRLKDVGVSLSVDDFGTGYSSLTYIRRLPVDTLKIDQSFVREVARDPDAASIVSAITSMARGLQLKTIGEGVESEEQRNVLHLLRCDYGQGFLFSPAVSAPDFDRFCAAGAESLS
jgi:diguanylate cyclase (GGDEF)-like protein/PAS domain S-box-containing protein